MTNHTHILLMIEKGIITTEEFLDKLKAVQAEAASKEGQGDV